MTGRFIVAVLRAAKKEMFVVLLIDFDFERMISGDTGITSLYLPNIIGFLRLNDGAGGFRITVDAGGFQQVFQLFSEIDGGGG